MRLLIVLVHLYMIALFGSSVVKDPPGLGMGDVRNSLGFSVPFLTSYIEGDQLYLHIPEAVLDQTLLFVRNDHDVQYMYLQVVWSLQRDRLLLKQRNIHSTSGIILPFKKGLALDENILSIFPLVKRDSSGYTINITDFVLHRGIPWEPGFTETPVPDLSFLIGRKDFADEVLIKVRKGLVLGNSKIAVPVVYGFSVLPEPMKARKFDYRMGFYDEETSAGHSGVKNKLANISKWRLEKQFPDQTVSVPKKPITFWISPEVPKQWRPYIRAGIEEWLPAFESAGFKDAIVVREMDSLERWQPFSIHSSLIKWSQRKYLRGSEEEDYGGTVAKVIDLRTGEILKGDIIMGSSEQTIMEQYFIRAAPLDKQAQGFPFPEVLTGRLYQVLAAHEAGHVLGIMDGNFGEATYPWDKMNDSLWLKDMGHTPSIMNYSRTSNIPQPEDSIPPTLLLQKVGPTDRYQIQWAYTEFPDGTSIPLEESVLERMIRWQDSVPWYRFNATRPDISGPANSDEVVETNDPVRSTTLALLNVKRVMGLLPEVTKDQKDNSRLERLYDKTLGLWSAHMKHVLTLIGGYDIHYKSINQSGQLYSPIPWVKQHEALDFILSEALDPPGWLTDPNFLEGTRYSTFPDVVMENQRVWVMELLSSLRIGRLEYMERLPGFEDVLQKYLAQLRSGLFRELEGPSEGVGPRRQELQQIYIQAMVDNLNRERPIFDPQQRIIAPTEYAQGIMLQELMILKGDIEKAMKRKWDMVTWGHWQLCLNKLNGIQ
ncbi:zinc-dependent metalloprotease [Flagellimonas sp. SN16]|uniref:zinc-dependent metalloprotease n=1 Tax=Flagellimonas sp. SN16 TaxID=3415142 RepID=UPI003C39C5E4